MTDENIESNRRPEINADNQNVPEIAEEAWAALILANNPERLFRHSTGLVRLETGKKKGVMVQILTTNPLAYELARAADWFRLKNGEVVPARPPSFVVKDMLSNPDPPLPYLSGVVEAPVFSDDMKLHQNPGYSELSQCYLHLDKNLKIPKVPEKPNPADINKAKDLIESLIGDFPFTSDAEKAHVISLMILPFVLNLIDAPIPLHLIEAPEPGTGKTLLAQAISYPAIGKIIASMSEGRDGEEWRKRITAKLISSPPYILIDNVRKRVESSSLASAITSRIWEDRILGASKIVRLPARCAWIVTGNNPTLSSEITRRTVRIKLDAKMDKPWTRKPDKFRHPNLLLWVKEYRGKLVWAALTMIQAWISEGCSKPENIPTLGMFEDWCEVMGGILMANGIPGFLGNVEEFYEASDAENKIMRSFIREWWNRHRQKEIGVKELYDINSELEMPFDLGKGNERSQRIQLGLLLSNMRDRQIDNYRVMPGKTYNRAQRYRLEPVRKKEVVENESNQIETKKRTPSFKLRKKIRWRL